MAIQLKSAAEIAKLREANLIVADVLDTLEAAAKPGISTWELNEIAATSGSSSSRPSRPSSATTATRPCSAPRSTRWSSTASRAGTWCSRTGDILSIDFGAFKDGWCGDSARTIPIGDGQPGRPGADDATRESLERAIAAVRPGQPPGRHRLGRPVARRGARLLGGPAVRGARHRPRHARGAPRPELRGRRQGAPAVAPGWWWPSSRWSTPGAPKSLVEDDGWTAVTKDGSLSAHFEHSVAITDDGPVVLSRA